MTIWTPKDDGFADLSSHDTFAAGVPHNTFSRLRREDPMHWSDWAGGKGFWSVTRHAAILALNGQPELLSSARGIRMEDQSYEEYLARRTFQELDEPEHMQTRVKVAKVGTFGFVIDESRHAVYDGPSSFIGWRGRAGG